MRMLRWICGNTMTDHIPSVTFRRLLGVESISKKIREGVYVGMDMLGVNVIQRRFEELNTYRFGAREREVGPVGRGLIN